MGSTLSHIHGFPVLSTENVLVEYWGRSDEISVQRHNNKVIEKIFQILFLLLNPFRNIEDSDEKQFKLVRFFSQNIHNK